MTLEPNDTVRFDPAEEAAFTGRLENPMLEAFESLWETIEAVTKRLLGDD